MTCWRAFASRIYCTKSQSCVSAWACRFSSTSEGFEPVRSSNGVKRWLAYRSDDRPRYAPGKLVRQDPSSSPPNNRIMAVPGLEDLGDPEFLRTHCFVYAGSATDSGVVVHKIDFRPNKALHVPDVEGSAFLDGESFVIRRAVFRLTRPGQLNPPVTDLQVSTTYREIFPGVTIIGDVRSVQSVRPLFPSSRIVRLTERQRLLDVRFLNGQPGEVRK